MSDATVEGVRIGAEAARGRERAAPQRSWPSMPKHPEEPIAENRALSFPCSMRLFGS